MMMTIDSWGWSEMEIKMEIKIWRGRGYKISSVAGAIPG
jgi:hypothetical protein